MDILLYLCIFSILLMVLKGLFGRSRHIDLVTEKGRRILAARDYDSLELRRVQKQGRRFMSGTERRLDPDAPVRENGGFFSLVQESLRIYGKKGDRAERIYILYTWTDQQREELKRIVAAYTEAKQRKSSDPIRFPSGAK
ncbi:MAG: hypothetical protein LBR47_02910 [Spirochaetaceae bacterium]|jgi:hypothetical protein|nr:hypothetical protein [Spirochaetaceae bacterium]